MIPVLFPADAVSFGTNGLGRLPDAVECTVTEERNGSYELYMRYPITGRHYADLAISRIICAVPADGKGMQPFRIYRMEKPLNGIVSVYAEHISYQLNHIPVMPFTASSCREALTRMVAKSAQENPFTVWTDKTATGNFSLKHPEEFRALLGGIQGSILDVYGKGEYEFDGYTVKLHVNRGTATGVVLRYGKNITDLTQDENIETTITGICPYWQDPQTGATVTLPEYAVWSAAAANYPYKRTAVIDFSADFQEAPTVAQLRERANKYITDNDIGIPKVSLDVEFIPLWQTDGVSIGAPVRELVLPSATINGDTVENIPGAIVGGVSEEVSFTEAEEGNIAIETEEFTSTQSDGAVVIPQTDILTFADTGQGTLRLRTDSPDSLYIEGASWRITYDDYKVLERVHLCDTLTVRYDALGVDATAKVVKTVYNVLTDRYDSLEIGEARTSLASQIVGIDETISTAVCEEVGMLQRYVDHQTELITGGLGGYVVLNYNANGQPQEILIMDTADMTTATNVIRMNRNGIGFSTSGYSGPYTSAWTIDGVFNADFIGAGTMTANRIAGGILTDLTGDNTWDLTTGLINFANFAWTATNSSMTADGTLTCSNANLSGDLQLSKTVNTWWMDANIGTVSTFYLGDTITRGGFQISATNQGTPQYTGKISISPAPYIYRNSYGAQACNIIHSDRSFLLTAQRAEATAWAGIFIEGSSLTLHSGDTGMAYSPLSVSGEGGTLVGTWKMPYYLRGCPYDSTTNSPNLYIGSGNSGVWAVTTSSSRRYKHDITDIDAELDPSALYNIPVRSYTYNEDYLSQTDINYRKRMIGFIAEEVAEVYPKACQYDANGLPEMWNANIMIPGMLALIQRQKKQIDKLEARISKLEKLIEEMSA